MPFALTMGYPPLYTFCRCMARYPAVYFLENGVRASQASPDAWIPVMITGGGLFDKLSAYWESQPAADQIMARTGFRAGRLVAA